MFVLVIFGGILLVSLWLVFGVDLQYWLADKFKKDDEEDEKPNKPYSENVYEGFIVAIKQIPPCYAYMIELEDNTRVEVLSTAKFDQHQYVLVQINNGISCIVGRVKHK